MGVFTAVPAHAGNESPAARAVRSWRDAWSSISQRIRRRGGGSSRLAILEQITVAPRQRVTLIEVEGERLLVGVGNEGPPQFFRLNAWAEIPVEGTVS